MTDYRVMFSGRKNGVPIPDQLEEYRLSLYITYNHSLKFKKHYLLVSDPAENHQ